MRRVERRIMITLEEYSMMERERIPYIDHEKTPVLDKIRRAGIDPSRYDLIINHKAGDEYLTVIQSDYELSLSEKLERAGYRLMRWIRGEG